MASSFPDGWSRETMRSCVRFFASGDPFLKLDYSSSGIPVLAKGDVKPFGRVVHGEKRFIRPELAEKRGYRITQPGDYLLTTRDLTQAADFLGLLAPIPDSIRFLVNQGANIVRFSEGVDGRYLVYWCNAPQYRSYIKGHYVGSTQIHLRKEDFLNAPVLLPPLPEQRAISGLLGAIDDRIDLNRRINENLERIARTIFRSWFLTFDPVRAKSDGLPPELPADIAELFPSRMQDSERGEIPEGWNLTKVGDIAEINAWTLSRTDPLPFIDYIEISEVMQGEIGNIARYERGGEPSRAKRKIRHGDTVISTVRPDRGSYFLALRPSESLIASTGFAVVTAKRGEWAFLYSLLTRKEIGEELGRLADGGAYPAIRPEVIGKIPVTVPNNYEIVSRFEHIVKPLYEKCAENRGHSTILAELRNALLPKLMSGQVRVPEAESLVGGQL